MIIEEADNTLGFQMPEDRKLKMNEESETRVTGSINEDKVYLRDVVLVRLVGSVEAKN